MFSVAPPMPMKIQMDEVLSQFLNVAEVEFSCDFSNVLLMELRWQIWPTTCTNCSVTLTSGVIMISIELVFVLINLC